MTYARYNVDDLLLLMTRLRDPETGCPWDIKQSYASIVPSTLEEAYEVADAIEREDFDHLPEELGDLLFQVVFYAQLAKEEGRFDFLSIVDTLTAKLLRRHPHVFPDGTLQSYRNSDDLAQLEQIKVTWENIKQQERSAKGQAQLLADVPVNLPALSRAAKLQKRAAKEGFDWPDASGALSKVDEELAELKQAMIAGEKHHITEEMGDLLFSCVNLARHIHVDAEQTLRRSSDKFSRRIAWIEAVILAEGRQWQDYNEYELDRLWGQAKLALNGGDLAE